MGTLQYAHLISDGQEENAAALLLVKGNYPRVYILRFQALHTALTVILSTHSTAKNPAAT